jgi:hypothetical protein
MTLHEFGWFLIVTRVGIMLGFVYSLFPSKLNKANENNKPPIITFLSKLGKILATAAGIATGVGLLIFPLLGLHAGKAVSTAGTIINDPTSIGQVVVQVEAILQAIAMFAAQNLKRRRKPAVLCFVLSALFSWRANRHLPQGSEESVVLC